MTRACQESEIEFLSGRKPLSGKRQQVHRSLRIVSRKGGSRMASKPELLHNQAADEIGQDFLLAYQRAVLLTLQRQGVLNEMQCRSCVQKLEEKARNTRKSKSVKGIVPFSIRTIAKTHSVSYDTTKRRSFYVTSSSVLPCIHG